MTIAIVGLGLIGGSMGLDLFANGFAERRLGVDLRPQHGLKAIELQLIDEFVDLETACQEADLIILAIPVEAVIRILPDILDQITSRQTVVDMGSTKQEIIASIQDHPKRARFVAAHPMAGTEFSGPEAAVRNLFQDKAAIICNQADSDPDAVKMAEKVFKSLFMRILHMDADEHDIHAAYVSHISHISSFALALTVLEKEKSEANIFNLASGGFRSTVRLAKSSPKMWSDVYQQNKSNILDVLDLYVEKIQQFRELIASEDAEGTFDLMEQANEIGRILEPDKPLAKSGG
jgi:prephenate dehydrogenase